jgi:hypothetical protein
MRCTPENGRKMRLIHPFEQTSQRRLCTGSPYFEPNLKAKAESIMHVRRFQPPLKRVGLLDFFPPSQPCV